MKKMNYGALLGILTVGLLTFSCGGGGDSRVSAPTAIEMVADVFQGNHSVAEVKIKMDAVMLAYNLEITDENYSRCGSALFSVCEGIDGVTEIDIIEHMLESNTGGYGVSFPDQVGLSATLLSVRANKQQ